MLPDLPEIKGELHALYMAEFRARLNAYLGIVSDAKRSFIVEGETTSIVRPDGAVEDTTLRRASAEATVPLDEVPALNHDKVRIILSKMADEMAAQISKGFFQDINNAVEKIGNVVSAEGKPPTADKIFEIWEKIHIAFNTDGTPQMPSIVVGTELVEPMRKIMAAIETDPTLRSRMDALMVKKFEEWRAREADRKLVG
jgi:hypothetical protein